MDFVDSLRENRDIFMGLWGGDDEVSQETVKISLKPKERVRLQID